MNAARSIVLGFLSPVWGLLRWRGLWRVAAAAPAMLMALVVLRIVADGPAIRPRTTCGPSRY
ncbi:MAG TPA: hypothetical protein VM576_02580 [Xanthomonadaceae bacterium]|nr:hypothetical protein [Xanthomonadaceae bacterium]